jgi:HD-like signal output (HDOD) protein
MVVERKLIFDKLYQLPSLPYVVQELIASFNKTDLDTLTLAQKIEHDQALSAKVLRMANSSFYGLTRKVGSIKEAVTILGFEMVRSIVISVGLVEHFPASPDSEFDRSLYWQRCYRVATLSNEIAMILNMERNFAFIAGMFYEIGLLVLDLTIPKQFYELLRKQCDLKLRLEEIEKSELGFDHFDIGADVIHQWNFPVEIEQLIRHWNDSDQGLLIKCNPLSCIVHLAVLIEAGADRKKLVAEVSKNGCAQIPINWEKIDSLLTTISHAESND